MHSEAFPFRFHAFTLCFDNAASTLFSPGEKRHVLSSTHIPQKIQKHMAQCAQMCYTIGKQARMSGIYSL